MSDPLPEGHPDRWLPADTSKLDFRSVAVELGGVAEISAELGVARNAVSMWAIRRDISGFPLPVLTLAMGPVYNMIEVREWFRNRPEPRNRPKEKTEHSDAVAAAERHHPPVTSRE